MKYRTFLLILTAFIVGMLSGRKLTEKEYLRRALELPDDIECFTNQDIEHILFNEPKLQR